MKEGISTDNAMGELLATMLLPFSKMELVNLSHGVKPSIKNACRKNGDKWGRPSDLNDETRRVRVSMRQKKIGLKKIATQTRVRVSTIQKFLASMEAVQPA